MGSLTEDPAFLSTTFVVIDFEATTPAGHPAQPIEVAALALRYQQNAWARVGTSTSLIRPPAFALVTPADTAQTGLTPEQLRQAPAPAEALGALDRRFTAGPYLLVAQHAATEAGIIHHQREHCPALARIDFIDTIPLARQIVPGLPNYKLDTLLAHFFIGRPADRHRAGADVEATAQVFFQLIRAADEMPQFSDLAALVKAAGRIAKCNLPPKASSSRAVAAYPRGERRVQHLDGCCSKDAWTLTTLARTKGSASTRLGSRSRCSSRRS